MQKFNERKATAAKGEYRNEEEKEKWSSVMKIEVMSSDESEEDEGDDVILVHPLPWLSAEVVAFKQKLDEEIKREKTPQARRQTKRRVIGTSSIRPCPPSQGLPSWAVK